VKRHCLWLAGWEFISIMICHLWRPFQQSFGLGEVPQSSGCTPIRAIIFIGVPRNFSYGLSVDTHQANSNGRILRVFMRMGVCCIADLHNVEIPQ
jgi:hypothetical protein